MCRKKITNFENFSNEMNGLENGSDIKPLKNDIEKLNQQEKQNRFNLYYSKKKTEKDPNIKLISEQEITETEEELKDFREKVDYEEIVKSPEIEEGIKKSNKRITQLGGKLGIDLKNRLLDDKDIHLLSEKDYNQKFNKTSNNHEGGTTRLNEVFVKKDFARKDRSNDQLMPVIQHELVHLVSKRGLYVGDEEITGISAGYSKDQEIGKEENDDQNSLFNRFNEGLTELTNEQLLLEDGYDFKKIGYGKEVILITELIKNISQKTGATNEEILSHFQVGMFEGKRGQLKILNDIYGKEALSALGKLKSDKESIINAARLFGLSDGCIKKIEDYQNNKTVEIDIGNKKCEIEEEQVDFECGENEFRIIKIGGKEIKIKKRNN